MKKVKFRKCLNCYDADYGNCAMLEDGFCYYTGKERLLCPKCICSKCKKYKPLRESNNIRKIEIFKFNELKQQ